MKIRLTDGREYAITVAGAIDGVMIVELAQPVELAAALEAFATGTAVMDVLDGDEVTRTYEGYTDVIGVKRDRFSGLTTVTLAMQRG